MTPPSLRTRTRIAHVVRAVALTLNSLLAAIGVTALLVALYGRLARHPLPHPLPTPDVLAITGAVAGLIAWLLPPVLLAAARRIEPLPWLLTPAAPATADQEGSR